MAIALDLIAERLPEVTVDDIRHRFSSVQIRDEKGFAAELQELVRDKLAALTFQLPGDFVAEAAPPYKPTFRVVTPQRIAGGATRIRDELAGKAAALVAQERWQPSTTDIQRGRAMLLDEFNMPSNMPIQKFAELAHKARQQIYADIQSRRLLSISSGPRKQKVPDWQLDQTKLALTRSVLAAAPEVDSWTIYKALSEPLESLNGQAPVDVVRAESIEETTRTVLNVLGIIPAEAGL